MTLSDFVRTISGLGTERRSAPSAALAPSTQLLGLTDFFRSDITQGADAQRSYVECYVVFRCAGIKADDIAKLPMRIGTDPDKPEDFSRDHPLARLLSPPPGGPNLDTSARTLIRHSVVSYSLHGAFAWEIVWSGSTPGSGVPVAFWPLNVAALSPRQAESGTRYFGSYDYMTSQGVRELAAEQVFYHWRPSQADWRQPESEVSVVAPQVAAFIEQERYDIAFLGNNATPAAMVILQRFAERQDFRAFKREWNTMFRGSRNAGRTAFIEAEGDSSQAADVKIIGQSNKDSDAVNRMTQRISGICAGMGVPMSKLDSSGRTFDNAAQEDVSYEKSTIQPLAADLGDAISIRLLPYFDKKSVAWFDLGGLKSRQAESRYTQISPIDAYQGGLVTQNEARAAVGEGPLDGGDEIKSQPDAPPVALPQPPQPAEVPKRQAREAEPDRDALRDEHQRAVDKKAESLEPSWIRAFQHLFDRQRKHTIARLTGKAGRSLVRMSEPNADGLFDPQHWKRETRSLAESLLDPIMAMTKADLIARLGGDSSLFNLHNPLADEFVRKRANQLAGQVTDTTYAEIQDALVKGINEGEDIDMLAERITKVFEGCSAVRAVTIARTETIGAYNAGTYCAALSYGTDVVAGKEWAATGDKRCRPTHRSAHGQVRAINEKFSVGGNPMDHPGDPEAPAKETVRCRCALLTLTPSEYEAVRGSMPLITVNDFVSTLTRHAASGER